MMWIFVTCAYSGLLADVLSNGIAAKRLSSPDGGAESPFSFQLRIRPLLTPAAWIIGSKLIPWQKVNLHTRFLQGM
jgi:hypothetical protein